MNYRIFKEVQVSEIGLGTWQLGSADWGTVNEEEAFGILQQFIENGGNFIDTADVYGMGISEKLIGKFLKRKTKRCLWPRNSEEEAMHPMVGRRILPLISCAGR